MPRGAGGAVATADAVAIAMNTPRHRPVAQTPSP
jgi:hypothetical protein